MSISTLAVGLREAQYLVGTGWKPGELVPVTYSHGMDVNQGSAGVWRGGGGGHWSLRGHDYIGWKRRSQREGLCPWDGELRWLSLMVPQGELGRPKLTLGSLMACEGNFPSILGEQLDYRGCRINFS